MTMSVQNGEDRITNGIFISPNHMQRIVLFHCSFPEAKVSVTAICVGPSISSNGGQSWGAKQPSRLYIELQVRS